jgi:hypothetical protein
MSRRVLERVQAALGGHIGGEAGEDDRSSVSSEASDSQARSGAGVGSVLGKAKAALSSIVTAAERATPQSVDAALGSLYLSPDSLERKCMLSA